MDRFCGPNCKENLLQYQGFRFLWLSSNSLSFTTNDIYIWKPQKKAQNKEVQIQKWIVDAHIEWIVSKNRSPFICYAQSYTLHASLIILNIPFFTLHPSMFSLTIMVGNLFCFSSFRHYNTCH